MTTYAKETFYQTIQDNGSQIVNTFWIKNDFYIVVMDKYEIYHIYTEEEYGFTIVYKDLCGFNVAKVLCNFLNSI